ncbi:MAG TPA: hypothetical protein VEG24_09735 [Gaiellaceae bacterium]|nr:hypothetical protein [Gaiellaceae bacterium]
MKFLRRHWAAVAAVVCAGLAAVLVLLAVDVHAWQTTIARDDVRFRAMHSHRSLWRPQIALPGDPALHLLGLGDAVAYRRAVQLFWFSRVGSDPETRQDLPTTRAQAQQSLQAIVDSARTAVERSSAANLLGVIVVTSPLVTDPQAQAQTLKRAAEYFQQAITINPANYDAKLNLQLVLLLKKPGHSKIGRDARGGYGFGRGHGVSQAGSGY